MNTFIYRYAGRWAAIALLGLTLAACETMDPGAPGNLVPRTVAEDPGLPALELNGTRFHVQTFGDPTNPVIVFLHGGPGSDHRSLLKLREEVNGRRLEDEYFLVFWDQRSTGLSKRHGKETLTIDFYMDDLNAIVDHYSPARPVYLIGESWGGMYGTNYINLYPERVAGAVLIEPGPMNGETAERLMDNMFDLDMGSEWLNDFAWSSQFLTADDHARMDYERMLGAKNSQPRFHQSTTNPSPIWRFGAAANKYITEDGQNKDGKYVYDFTSNLAAFASPVLFIAGSMSEVLGASLQEEQILHYPSATLEVVNGAGHDVAWVKTPAVLAHIFSYLDDRKGEN